VGLLRGARWATKLAVAMTGFMTLLVGSVAGMAAVMTARDDPSADPAVLAAVAAGALASAAVYVRLLRAEDHDMDDSSNVRLPASSERGEDRWLNSGAA